LLAEEVDGDGGGFAGIEVKGRHASGGPGFERVDEEAGEGGDGGFPGQVAQGDGAFLEFDQGVAGLAGGGVLFIRAESGEGFLGGMASDAADLVVEHFASLEGEIVGADWGLSWGGLERSEEVDEGFDGAGPVGDAMENIGHGCAWFFALWVGEESPKALRREGKPG